MPREKPVTWENSKEGARAVKFIQALRLVGDFNGEPFKLRDWQETYIRKLFGHVDANGKRIYRKSMLFLPRKQGKTCIISSIVLLNLIGTKKKGQEIYSAATTRDQAARTFAYCREMIMQDEYLRTVCKVLDMSKRIIYEPLQNVYTALASDAHTAHGLNPSINIFDELHAFKKRELWDVLNSGYGARQEPLTIVITTAGTNTHGVCYEEYTYAKQVQDGIIDDPTYLPAIYELPQDQDWRLEENWFKAMPALGDFCSLEFIRNEYKQADRIPARADTFRQMYLNQWITEHSRWLDIEAYDECMEDIEIPDGTPCFAGLDLASVKDLAALVLLFQVDDKYVARAYCWIPENTAMARQQIDQVPYLQWIAAKHIMATPGDCIDYDVIQKHILDLHEKYPMQLIGCDPWNATMLAQSLTKQGMCVEFFRQGFISMNYPCKMLERIILNRKLSHDGNPVLRWCASNVVAETDEHGNIKCSKAKSVEKIDAIVALVMALGVSIGTSRDEASVYEERGLLII